VAGSGKEPFKLFAANEAGRLAGAPGFAVSVFPDIVADGAEGGVWV